MPWGFAAAGIAAGVGAVASGVIGANAADKASKATQQSADQAVAEERRQYDQTREDQAPWLQTGKSALDALAGMYGVSGSGNQTPDYSAFYKSPDYDFAQQEGIKGVDAGAASRGYLDSGETRKAEIAYSSNLAKQNFGSYADRLAGLAGVGQTAATNLGAVGANTSGNISNIIQSAGNNRASSYLTQGKSYADSIGTAAGAIGGIGMNYGMRNYNPSPASNPTNLAPISVTPSVYGTYSSNFYG